MKALKVIVYTASLVIFGICLYSFLLGNGVSDFFVPRSADTPPPTFKNDPISWYFLAKGLFCSLSLYLSVTLIDTIHGLKSAILRNVQTNNKNTVQSSTTMPPNHTVVATPSEKSWYKARQGVGH